MILEDEKLQEGVSLFDLCQNINYARDLYSVCKAIHKDKVLLEHESFKKLKEQQEKLLKIIIEKISEIFFAKLDSAAQALFNHRIGNAKILKEEMIKKCQPEIFLKKLLDSFSRKNTLSDPIIGQQLIRYFLNRYRQIFVDTIMQRETQKIAENTAKEIDRILVDFKSNDTDYINLMMPTELKIILEERKETISEIVNELGLQSVLTIYEAFKELAGLDKNLRKYKLTSEEIEHLNLLFKEYYSNSKERKISPDINKMVMSLSKIQPILNFKLEDLILFLDKDAFSSKAEFLFKKIIQNLDFHTTFEGLAEATNAKNEAVEILNIIIKQLSVSKVQKPETIKMIKNYIDSLENFFQITMRFVMPLNEIIKGCQIILNKVESAFPQDPIINTINNNIKMLNNCNDVLRQKTISINALKDITYFIKMIEELAKQPEPLISLPLFKNNYKTAFNEILIYFNSISRSSRTENHTNFRQILAKLNEIINKHHIKLSHSGKSENEKLLIEIFDRFNENVKQYQNEAEVVYDCPQI